MVQGVRCVVHYQIPASADVYVHRSGRTARAAEEGLAVALVTPREAPRFTALLRVSALVAPNSSAAPNKLGSPRNMIFGSEAVHSLFAGHFPPWKKQKNA